MLCWIGFELELLFSSKQNRLRVINRWVPRWARINLWIFGVRVEPRGLLVEPGRLVSGRDDAGRGRIFIANHRSGMDIPVVLTTVEAHCISRHDVANWPVIGRGAQRIGTLFVDRSSRRSGAAVLKEVAHVVERGEAVAMFPEGTAYPGDEVRAFHNGAFNAARRSNAQIVPMGFAYDNDAAYFEAESFMVHIKRVAGLKRLRVAVEIGTPLEYEELDTADIKKLAHQQVQELVNQARARLEDC
ncbi:lysophospholipid acyltransferase family protein [Bythopirellula polymerisocia]|uniref:1-acyl-sn-glycerol-3-phosphate acyltransferase n=1 Tax=Bythopirellula polymerisocia TaxID=2528003 RepID=A0A5C6CNR5_9BACT|nr:lysophospholipid acyltransferase family protein [Bythopirellula polymerisocia]TWU24696.1 1-acyl-sn-glycerol-3-phosphate acyltransferase [Bythopirellula polymerisocia]